MNIVYTIFMPKKPISVTLDTDNLLWLRGQSIGRSVSEVLDALVADARRAGRVGEAAIRSVRGTIDIPPDDPDLVKADAYVRALFERSVNRPVAVKEPRGRFAAPRKRASPKGSSRG